MYQTKLKKILEEINDVVNKVDNEKIKEIVSCIVDAPQIFITGVGRSGYMMRAFAMRMMHGNLNAFVVGDTSTPAARKGDLLILGSGSGETESLKAYAKKAKKIGLHIITITSFPESTLGSMADFVLQVSAPTPKSEKESRLTSIQPMANLFEQSLLLYLDALVMEIMEVKGLTSDQMFNRHANLE